MTDQQPAEPARRPTASTITDTQLDQLWARAERDAAAIERVRAECDRIEAAVTDNPTSPDLAGGYLACLRHIRAALDEHQEQPTTGEQQAEDEQLVHIGWWCWRGDNHGHLVTSPCRSDNVPLHAPTEWADDMRAVIQRIEDGDDEEEQP